VLRKVFNNADADSLERQKRRRVGFTVDAFCRGWVLPDTSGLCRHFFLCRVNFKFGGRRCVSYERRACAFNANRDFAVFELRFFMAIVALHGYFLGTILIVELL
jgi:hypothetical protein